MSESFGKGQHGYEIGGADPKNPLATHGKKSDNYVPQLNLPSELAFLGTLLKVKITQLCQKMRLKVQSTLPVSDSGQESEYAV